MGSLEGRKEYDVILAGGGTAACIIAGRLAESDPNLSILVVEQGANNLNDPTIVTPAAYPSHMQPTSKNALFYKSNREEALNGREAVVPAGGVLGGGSSVNFMMYTRGLSGRPNPFLHLTLTHMLEQHRDATMILGIPKAGTLKVCCRLPGSLRRIIPRALASIKSSTATMGRLTSHLAPMYQIPLKTILLRLPKLQVSKRLSIYRTSTLPMASPDGCDTSALVVHAKIPLTDTSIP